MKHDRKRCDIALPDTRELSGSEWNALIKRMIRRAHIERSEAFRRALDRMTGALFGKRKS